MKGLLGFSVFCALAALAMAKGVPRSSKELRCGFVRNSATPIVRADEICNIHCDGRNSSLASNGTRSPVTSVVLTRQITLHISDADNMAFATISNGVAGDEVWLDRSFDAGISWTNGSKLGHTLISSGATNATTLMYNVDDPETNGLGALRACGQPGGVPDTVCTEWARSTVLAETNLDAAATALMQYYDGQLWHTIGWWNGANALTALIQYMKLTGSRNHFYVVNATYERNLDGWDGNFTSDALDDTEWWALAWIDAYDLTGEQKYLDMAIFDADYIYQYVDNVCGGGLWWNIYKTYKNAITNELYIQIAAALHNRIPGDVRFLNQAISLWTWFKQSGMINQDYLVNDGLTDRCVNNNDTTWTYNQGVILGGLVELYKATGQAIYLAEAKQIADAVVNSTRLSPNGILTEPCRSEGCDCNQISFKGIFMRNLAELNRNLTTRPYTQYIQRQGESIQLYNRNALSQFGIYYAGPLELINAGTTQSGMEAFTAAIL